MAPANAVILPDFDFGPLLQHAMARKLEENVSDAENTSDVFSVLSSPPNSPILTTSTINTEHIPILELNNSMPPPPQNRSSSRKHSQKKHGHQNRKRRHKEENKRSRDESNHASALKKKHLNNSCIIPMRLNLTNIRVSQNGFTGYRTNWAPSTEYMLEEMVGPNSKFKFRLIVWDGRSTLFIKDQNGHIPVFGVPPPEDPSFHQAMDALMLVVEKERQNIWAWSPSIFKSYMENKKELTKNNTNLQWNFNNSVFAAISINFGPRTVTSEHTDHENHADGFCVITPLAPSEGGYDYQAGSHLILWDLGVVIEFSPKASLYILSASLQHSNRYSITQYSAGSLFRWMEHGFQPELSYYASLSPEEKAREVAKDTGRWKHSLELMLHTSQLAVQD
ncbi:hypothetical protein L218DRAFT_965023 [Marasmius fiardii PR-910]|nr:hypothetical protein L218DRAFT_965023 [Marasmius fiardii PR-910]